MAQTSLFGYLKTRMGTRYREYFEDDAFVPSIRIAAVKLFVSCLADFCVYGAALAATGGRLSADEAADLAQYCFEQGLAEGLEPEDRQHVPDDAAAEFAARLRGTAWPDATRGETAFAGSAADLIRFAPVVDEFKARDGEIVRNSIRFRWQGIRESLRQRLDADAICLDRSARAASRRDDAP